MDDDEREYGYCGGKLCHKNGSILIKPRLIEQLTKVSYETDDSAGYGHRCALCIKDLKFKSKCDLCAALIRQDHSVISVDNNHYCLGCIYNNIDDYHEFRDEYADVFKKARMYAAGDRSEDVVNTVMQTLEDIKFITYFRQEMKKDLRKEKVFDLLYDFHFLPIDKHRFVAELTEEQLDMLSSDKVVRTRDFFYLLLNKPNMDY